MIEALFMSVWVHKRRCTNGMIVYDNGPKLLSWPEWLASLA